ncbi:hypothetical protein SLEP1_g40980 [Rubroshorea leprosula]|uniref:Disease resistance R13L4/SHOC-2-like LRR domain-containing protein n=1 Tax=Rubroshorea leprosula TaxID=152421 RepID=A0AAV5L607_9ROSI|nr:hypothetical protein SLEP1_g40980 [Rubroshorea leprosula]
MSWVWRPTFNNACAWFHVTCDYHSSVTRVDLGSASLSGQLVPQLGQLKNLQYLELFNNNISGPIPSELGNLTNLVSLDLYLNSFTGSIPESLGKLSKLRYLRLNNNNLTGPIPISLTNILSLQVLDLSNNRLSGEVPDNGSFLLFRRDSFANNLDLCGPVTGRPCPAPISSSGEGSATGAIVGAISGGAALLFIVLAIAFAFKSKESLKFKIPRWDEWQKVEILQQEVKLASHPNTNWIIDSTENLHAIELSGPSPLNSLLLAAEARDPASDQVFDQSPAGQPGRERGGTGFPKSQPRFHSHFDSKSSSTSYFRF